jgi:hypothetical protein
LSKVETAPAFVDGWMLPGDIPFTCKTLIEQEAAVCRARDGKRPRSQTAHQIGRSRRQAVHRRGFSVIQIIGAVYDFSSKMDACPASRVDGDVC